MTDLPIIVSDTDITVAGFVDEIQLQLDVGSQGQRGSLIFSGNGEPPATPAGTDTIFEGVSQFQINDIYINTASGVEIPIYQYLIEIDENPADWVQIGVVSAVAGAGDVVGPATGTDNGLVTFDGTTGKLVKDSGITLTTGTAVPNSTQPQGSKYIRTTTLGDHEYVSKGAGVWAPTGACDTGLRDLSGETLSNGWAVADSLFTVQRVGSMVTVTFKFNSTGASATTAYTLPAGFGAPSQVVVSAHPTDNSALVWGGVYTDNTLRISAYGSKTYWMTFTYVTDDAWPTSLPGTPA